MSTPTQSSPDTSPSPAHSTPITLSLNTLPSHVSASSERTSVLQEFSASPMSIPCTQNSHSHSLHSLVECTKANNFVHQV